MACRARSAAVEHRDLRTGCGMRSAPHSLKMDSYARRALREKIARRDGGICAQCGDDGDFELDHIEPIWRAPDRARDDTNLQILCTPCHKAKTARERSGLLAFRRKGSVE
jgi:5-methylcytosine-specific restriction endonuclease McrA